MCLTTGTRDRGHGPPVPIVRRVLPRDLGHAHVTMTRAPVAGLRTRGRSRSSSEVPTRRRLPRRSAQCSPDHRSETALVPAHRCGAVPESHRVPSRLAPPSAGNPGAAARTTSTHDPTRSAVCGKTAEPAADAQQAPRSGRTPPAVEFRSGCGGDEIRATGAFAAFARCSPHRGDHGGHDRRIRFSRGCPPLADPGTPRSGPAVSVRKARAPVNRRTGRARGRRCPPPK